MAMQNNKLGAGGRQSKREREKWLETQVGRKSLASVLVVANDGEVIDLSFGSGSSIFRRQNNNEEWRSRHALNLRGW